MGLSVLVDIISRIGEFVNQIPDSTVVGVIASFASAMIVYAARQSWERTKLRRALLTEVNQMEGIKECADQMARVNEPPGRQLRPDDVPAEGTIPTGVYESNTGNIGLLRGIIGKDELESVVEFYSKVLRYKSIIREIKKDGFVSNSDQEDLYDSIQSVEEQREQIVESDQFVSDD
ncbi:hypothetical protein ACYJ1Y_15890 [Natrialbaceae archaeon A-gly3]